MAPNIRLTEDKKIAKICDFGLVGHITKHLDESKRPDPRQYGAPEQDESLANCTFSSDIYSFGMVAYQLLAGSLPKGHPIRKPSEANTQVPSSLDIVLLRCLKRDIKERYQSVREVLNELNAVVLPVELRKFPLSSTEIRHLLFDGIRFNAQIRKVIRRPDFAMEIFERMVRANPEDYDLLILGVTYTLGYVKKSESGVVKLKHYIQKLER